MAKRRIEVRAEGTFKGGMVPRRKGSVKEERVRMIAQQTAEEARVLEIRARNARELADRLEESAEAAGHIARQAALVAKSLPAGWDQ